MKRYLLLLLFLFASNISVAQETDSLTDAQINAAIKASSKTRGDTTFWRSDKFGIIFGYDERWRVATPSQKSTATVINWVSRKSGGLMATCYLEINNSEIGELKPDQIQRKSKQIVDAFMQNGRLRDPNIQLTDWRFMVQDNHPVVYIERDMSVVNLNNTIRTRIYSMVTSWHGYEVNMECSSSIPITMPKASGVVEGPILKILGSVQFVRGKSKIGSREE